MTDVTIVGQSVIMIGLAILFILWGADKVWLNTSPLWSKRIGFLTLLLGIVYVFIAFFVV